MNTETQHPLTRSLLDSATQVTLRPRYEGSNICTWIGFKHVNYLVEEAVLEHFRACGLPPRALFENHGLGLDLVDLDTRILHALHMDDTAQAHVLPVTDPTDSTLTFRVTLTLDREGRQLTAVTSTARVSLRTDDRLGPPPQPSAGLERFVVRRLGGHLPAASPASTVAIATQAADTVLSRGRGVTRGDVVLDQLTAGKNAFGWKWRIPYPYCHFSERLQMSGYLRQMEEVVDLFLADRGISIRRLLDERRWIPVVPRSRVRVLDEALMEEDLYTLYTVEDVFKDLTYTARMDCYVVRESALVHTATGTITHGYAVIENRRDWRLVPFDQRVIQALAGAWTTGQDTHTPAGEPTGAAPATHHPERE